MIKPGKWKIVSSKYLVKDRWMTLRADTVVTERGVTVEPFYVVESSDWVHILAFDKDKRILLVRQYRHGNQEVMWEIPCGVIDAGEDPLVAAKRELLEETGCVTEKLQVIGELFANPARQNNKVHNVVAFDVSEDGQTAFDITECIEHKFFTLDEFHGMVDRGEFSHAVHLASVYLALRTIAIEP